MKTLANIKTIVSQDGKSVTITGDIVDKNYNMILVRRVTVGHLNRQNMRHIRHIQVSDQAVFTKYCADGFAWELDDLVAIAAQINPKTSFAPVISNVKGSLQVSIASELPSTLQWQLCADKRLTKTSVWTAIAEATQPTLAATDSMKGNWVRCQATNAVGTSFSVPQIVK